MVKFADQCIQRRPGGYHNLQAVLYLNMDANFFCYMETIEIWVQI